MLDVSPVFFFQTGLQNETHQEAHTSTAPTLAKLCFLIKRKQPLTRLHPCYLSKASHLIILC